MGRLHRDTTELDSNPFRQHKDTNENKPTRYYSSRQETNVAKAIGGKKTANSGATAYSKGDVTVGEDKHGWLIECKTCMKDQNTFTIRKEWFDKNLEESIYMKKDYNAVVVNFGPSSKKNYYIIDEQTFNEMKDLLDAYNNGLLVKPEE